MQESWRRDGDKLTFIVCLPHDEDDQSRDEKMIGDVNLFLSPADDDEDEGSGTVVGELELMIALPAQQNKGYGRAALVTFMDYVLTHWEEIAREYTARSGSGAPPALAFLRARINEANGRSIGLFESVGFTRVGEGANYFGEVELRWKGGWKDLRGCKGWQEWREVRYE